MSERTMGRKLNLRPEHRQLELVFTQMRQRALDALRGSDLDAVVNDGAISLVALQDDDGVEPNSREPFMKLLELGQEQRLAA